MRRLLLTTALVVTALTVSLVGIVGTAAAAPPQGEMWICPSVSTNNPNGMWVVGNHGAYYIIMPGTASHNWDRLNPTGNLERHAAFVEDLGQVPAGWGLYQDLPTYPYFEGMAMVLDDGAATWGLTMGGQFISAGQEIPLASAVFW